MTFGGGGHSKQALLLYEYLLRKGDDKESIVTIHVDHCKYKNILDVDCLVIPPFRKPAESLWLCIFRNTIIPSYLFHLFKIIIFMKQQNVSTVVSFGPNIAVIIGLICKITKVKFLFIESWSRVTTLSKAGKIILKYKLASEFLVQWESVAKTYNLKFIGRMS